MYGFYPKLKANSIFPLGKSKVQKDTYTIHIYVIYALSMFWKCIIAMLCEVSMLKNKHFFSQNLFCSCLLFLVIAMIPKTFSLKEMHVYCTHRGIC